MTPPSPQELLQDELQQRANRLAGTVQGHRVTFDGIHWTCIVGVELQVGDGETTELEAEFSGTVRDDPGEHLAEVWDWVQEECSTWSFKHDQARGGYSALSAARQELRDRGYLHGFISEHECAAICFGSRKLRRFDLMTKAERAKVHGVLWFGAGPRLSATVHVTLFPDVDPGPGLPRTTT